MYRVNGVSLQAFAWFSDLMVEHAEIFWSLFAVDMDAVLEMQPPDTWDSFPLFQMLNDYLRSHGMDWNTFFFFLLHPEYLASTIFMKTFTRVLCFEIFRN